jgi:hypothetical protein
MKSILDALLSQYVDPYKDWQAPMQMPQGAMQPQPGPQNAMQAMQAPMQSPMQGPMQGPGPAPQAPQAPPPTQNPLSDVESALQAGVQQEEDPMRDLMAFGERTADFENKWKNTQERRFRGWAGGIEAISDMVREKKLRPQRQAVDAERNRLQLQMMNQRTGDRANALVQMGHDPETAQAIAKVHMSDKTFDPSKYKKTAEGITEELKRANRKKILSENPDLAKRIGPEAADKFWLTGNWSGKDGLSITTAKDGTVMMTMGGEPIPLASTANKGEAVGDLMGAEDSMDQLQGIMEIANPNFLGYSSRIKGWLGGQLDKAGWSDNEHADFAAGRNAFAREITRRMLDYRKSITGVAGGEKEMAKIEEAILNDKMGKAEFAAEINSEIRAAQRAADQVRRRLGLPEVEWPDVSFQWPDEDKDEKGKDKVRADGRWDPQLGRVVFD